MARSRQPWWTRASDAPFASGRNRQSGLPRAHTPRGKVGVGTRNAWATRACPIRNCCLCARSSFRAKPKRYCARGIPERRAYGAARRSSLRASLWSREAMCVGRAPGTATAMLLNDEAPARPGSTGRTQVWRVDGANTTMRSDSIATEEPLEVRVVAGGQRQTVAITMRTPGADFELAAGFLYGEGVLADPRALRRITYCVDPEVDPDQRYNIVNVELRATSLPELGSLERHFFTSSACGVCGKAGLEALHLRGCAIPPGDAWLTPSLVTSLPEKLRAKQSVFQSTGGLHAAALFDASGELVA